MMEVEVEGKFGEDGGYSMEDYWHCSIQGVKRVEVLGSSDWSCRLGIEMKGKLDSVVVRPRNKKERFALL
jgi:hypothetical protein